MEEQIVSQAVGSVFGLSPTVSFWLWTMMIIYILIMLGIGWFSGRKIEGLSDFLVAGRRLPLWMATATLLATWFGAGSSMGVAASVYSDGIASVIAETGSSVITETDSSVTIETIAVRETTETADLAHVRVSRAESLRITVRAEASHL